VKSGSGKTLSNQRGYRVSQLIRNFDAVGSVTIDEKMVNPEAVKELLTFAGRVVGIGASRKMGYGRFALTMPLKS